MGPPVDAAAAEIEGVTFPDRYVVQGVDLELNGTALLRYRVFFKVYVAALYLGQGVAPEDLFADTPKRLEIEYFYAFKAADFAKSTIEGIARNVAPGAFEDLQPRIEEMNRLYRDVAPGDRYALTYLPGVGTELSLNGAPLGRVAGAGFGAAMFSIWLGDVPLDSDLKRRLLGKR
jgi:hypothetical protein